MNTLIQAGLVGVALALAGCGGSSNSSSGNSDRDSGPDITIENSYAAVIQTVSSGYDAGAIEIVDLDAASWISVPGFYSTLETDYSVWAQGSKFYQLGQFQLDSLLKADIANPNTPEWQYSTKDLGAATGNPTTLVFKDENTAYLLNYGDNTSWQVNLDPSDESELRSVALDLQAYGGGDVGAAEATAGVVVNGRLYVLMQRLDAGWVPGQAFIAVFDTATNTEIDLNIDASLNGIPLLTKNPQGLEYVDGVGLVVYSAGRYYPQEFTGGIEVVNLADHSTSMLVEDGGAYGQITGGAIVSPTQGYFVAYAGWQDTSLYRFNPSTGEVGAAPVSGISGVDIQMLAVDPEDRVWVGLADAMEPHIVVLDAADESVVSTIQTSMNPIGVAFTERQVTTR